MEKRIEVKSSSNESIYTVIFRIEDDKISINCNCLAGIHRRLCKHRLNLLDGDVSAIVDPLDIENLSEIIDVIDKNKIADLYKELNLVEEEIQKLNKLKKQLRSEIGFKFANGF